MWNIVVTCYINSVKAKALVTTILDKKGKEMYVKDTHGINNVVALLALCNLPGDGRPQ